MQTKFLKEHMFKAFLVKLFRNLNYKVDMNVNLNSKFGYNRSKECDLYMTSNNNKYVIEVKYSSSGKIGQSLLHETAKDYLLYLKNDENLIIISNVWNNKFTKFSFKSLENNVYFMTLNDIFYIIQDDEILKQELQYLLDFSTENIVNYIDENVINTELLERLNISKMPKKIIEIDNEIERLKTWNEYNTGNDNSKSYEELCTNVLKYLFSDELSIWNKQQHSNDNLYIFDLICRIKKDTNSEFWNMIETYFQTKYIVFEFKNYSEKITQKEIYTTEKYLYEKALRKVAIVISCFGTNKNADKAIGGILRESGKLIIALTNDDLIEMIKIRKSNNYPSEYLLGKLDDMLVTLNK